MSIRIVRNDAGNCINFYGTSNPTYWNACLSASIDENFPDRINVRNDIRTAEEGTDVYEFYQIPYTDFSDRNDNSFESASEAAQYITDNANVSGDTGTFIFSESDTLDAQRESTDTTVLFSNGDIYAVNALRAVDAADGTITIQTIRGDKQIYTKVRHYNVTVNNGAVSFNTVNAAVNRLNEVLSGGTVGSESGTVSSGASFTSAPTTFEVYGARIVATGAGTSLGYESTTEVVNGITNFDTSNGILSVQSISNSGDYFEFEQLNGDWSQTQGLTFGLFDETTYDRSDLESDVSGNAVKSVIRLRIKNSPFIFKDPASTFGRINENGLANQLDTRTKFRVGLDSENRGFISMQLDDGTFQNVGRTETAITAGTDLKFVAIFPLSNRLDGIRNMTVNTVNDLQPTLTWYYIESPDGSFYYPLFASDTEANYVDEVYGTAGSGSGSSHTHIFPDQDPTPQTWYMPDSYMFHDQSTAPTLVDVFYNEIATEPDSSHIPPDLTLNNQSWAENYGVNLQIVPAGGDPATVSGLPSGLTYLNGFITGTTPYVPEDTTYTVTVVRSNSYGSNTQTFTMTVQDNSSLGNLSGFTELDGNFLQPNRVILTHDALLQYDTQLNPGEEMTYSYNSGYNPPTIGILSGIGTTNFANYNSSTDTLGVSPYDFAQTNQWDLRYVSFGGDIGSGNVRHNLVGWTTNTTIQGSASENIGVEFKLEYGVDGYIKLYRGDVEMLSSGSTFTGAQTLTFAGFEDQAQSDLYIPSNLTISITGAGSSTPPSGFVDPLLTGEMASTTVLGNGDAAAATLTQELEVNHRFIVSQEFIEQNFFPAVNGGKLYIGIPKATADWTNGINELNDFDVAIRITAGTNSHTSTLSDGTSAHTISVGSATDAYYEYGIEWDGTNLYVIACNTNDLNTTASIADGGTFVRTHVYAAGEYSTVRTGALPIVIGVSSYTDVTLNTSGLNNIRIPFGARTILAGENTNGTGDFKVNPSNTDYDNVPSGHTPEPFTFGDVTSMSAGQTYKFVYHPSMESTDFIEFRLASDNTTVYTTGITTFDNAPNSDPQVTGGYKGLTVGVATDAPPLRLYNYNSFTSSYDSGRAVSISGSTYVESITGITQEGPAANQTGTNIFDASDHGWLSIDEQLGAGERLVLSGAFLSDAADAMGDNTVLNFGVKDTSWANTISDFNTGFEGGIRFTMIRYSSTDIQMYVYKGESPTAAGGTLYTTVAGLTSYNAFLEVTSTGNNVRGGVALTSTNDATTDAYADWATTTKIQSGAQGYGITSIDVMVQGFALSGTDTTDADDIDWTGLSEISIPAPAPSLTTSWTKALDFSGSSERALQVTNLSSYNPIRMADLGRTVSAHTSFTSGTHTSDRADARPWACAVVFSSDNNSSNQHIWNQGEGAGSTEDNIYLRLDSNRNLYFGWGRTGALNECKLTTLSSTAGTWYGVYVAHTGERLSGSDATATNLADCFDIRIVDLSTGTVGTNLAISSNWTTTGGRMDRTVAGDLTVGGRGSNRNFHGKVASMVVTTLKQGQTMPTTTEISEMVRDPQQWQIDYKNGQDFRSSISSSTSSNFTGTSHYNHTQIWLMGDGANDAFAQIRNDVSPNTQGGASLNMISMVSNDIETVNISGLT